MKASQNVNGQPPLDRGKGVCTRFVMRMLQTPIPPVEESLRNLSGPALIVGQNAVGLALRKQIEALGVPAMVLPLSDDVERRWPRFDKLWQTHATASLPGHVARCTGDGQRRVHRPGTSGDNAA